MEVLTIAACPGSITAEHVCARRRWPVFEDGVRSVGTTVVDGTPYELLGNSTDANIESQRPSARSSPGYSSAIADSETLVSLPLHRPGLSATVSPIRAADPNVARLPRWRETRRDGLDGRLVVRWGLDDRRWGLEPYQMLSRRYHCRRRTLAAGAGPARGRSAASSRTRTSLVSRSIPIATRQLVGTDRGVLAM
jgi:hypothetical protein